MSDTADIEATIYERLTNDLRDLQEQERILERMIKKRGCRSGDADLIIKAALLAVRAKIREIKLEKENQT